MRFLRTGALALAVRSGHATKALPKGVVSLPIIPILNQSAYGAVLYVGTPPQRNTLLIDTGSSETPGLSAPGSIACVHKQCALYGTYNNRSSSSAVFVSNDYGTAVGADAYGGLISDTVSFGGRTFPGFAVGQQLGFETPSRLRQGEQYGFLGLAQYCSADGRRCDTFNTVLLQLRRRGEIAKSYFSLYLGPPNASAQGEILYGGIDRAKQASPSFATPMILESDSGRKSNMVLMSNWTLSLVKNDDDVHTTKYHIPASQDVTLVDSGNPSASFSAPMARAMLDFFNVTAPLYGSPYLVDCRYRRAPAANAATVFFNAGRENITMPLASLVNQLPDGTCQTYVDGFGFAIGAPMMRNMYLGYDLENLQVHFSQAKYTDARDVVAA